MSGSDRRPIAARGTRPAQAAAGWLIRLGASADGISIAGMISGMAAGLCLAGVWLLPDAARPLWLLAALFAQLRLAANLLDGMVAIGRGIASPRGELFNEVPDRVSDTAILVGLGLAAGGDWALGLGAALAAMATAYVRAVGRAAGAPSDFRGPMAKQHRMALVTALALWCAMAPLDWIGTLPRWVLIAITLLATLTALRRLAGAARALDAR
ncbi:MAG TPA: CDP-alcohol phosphatidyltransferase family protein [Roseomonas sp.]|jgi:phosphatidylglycerophosphate synthase